MTYRENLQKNVNIDNLNFGIKTIITLGLNLIVASIFLGRLQGKIERLDEVVTDLKEAQTQSFKDDAMQRAKIEADVATINVRLAIVENQLRIQPKPNP